MNRTQVRLAALERQARRDHTVTVWYQDSQGADAYTSSKPPGVVLTRAQLEARPEPANGLRILVQYVDASPTARKAGERF
jgi:hypothetical protein